ncbi:MAG: hypothetical protein NC206_03395 [Bacteroides sp.]|nr:hypothetical protein [Roseburia sp.]MCM1346110.1 hypothetical protein [Bacteroides sp.]MCM1420746.1 hypothetical protein [Bacteroides sp.]
MIVFLLLIVLCIIFAGGPFEFLIHLGLVVVLSLIVDVTVKPWLDRRSKDITRPKIRRAIAEAVEDGCGTCEDIEKVVKEYGVNCINYYYTKEHNPYVSEKTIERRRKSREERWERKAEERRLRFQRNFRRLFGIKNKA